MVATAYVPRQIFTGNEWLSDYSIIVEDGTISALRPTLILDASIEKIFIDGYILPAFIDAQIYGAGGKLFAAYPTAESLEILYKYCRQGGATLFLPTIATNSLTVFYKCIDAVREYWHKGGKGVLGLHLEGPWINEIKRGAHVKEYIHAPTLDEVKEILLYGSGVIKMITLAPEVCSQEVVRFIQSQNIIITAGHSNATFRQAMQAFENGIHAVTHLYNAMSPLHHREPGLVGAVFQHQNVMASIIPDGHHVDFEAISIAKKIMNERLFVITDAVTETSIGHYQHQFQLDKYVCGETLSGSALTMHKAFMNLITYAAISVDEAIRMCSLYPAKVIGVDNEYGKIAPGYKAQFIVTNDEYEIVDVIT